MKTFLIWWMKKKVTFIQKRHYIDRVLILIEEDAAKNDMRVRNIGRKENVLSDKIEEGTDTNYSYTVLHNIENNGEYKPL